MFETDLKYIYVTKNSFKDYICAWDSSVGIKMFDGCHYFASAKRMKSGDGHYWDGNIGLGLTNADVGGHVPRGTAWLVNTTSGVWERVDQDMMLWDPITGRPV